MAPDLRETGAAEALVLEPAAFGCPAAVRAHAVAVDGRDAGALAVRKIGGRIEVRLPKAAFGLLRLH